MGSLVVATYNVRHGLGRDGVLDFERCARLVGEVTPDLIAMQELDRGMKRSNEADQPAVLADVTGMEVAFFPTLTRDLGEYGIAVAARHPLSADFTFLPTSADEEPRGLVTARAGGICLLATHLSRSRATRRTQLKAIAAELPAHPAVVAGDFNATASELEALATAGLVVPSDTAPTHRRRRIDHIIPGPGIGLVRTWVVSSPASDHDLLAAELCL